MKGSIKRGGMRKNKALGIIFSVAVVFLSPFIIPHDTWAAKEVRKVIAGGDFFPIFSLPNTFSTKDMDYLGLRYYLFGLIKGDSFSVKDINAEVVLLEYTNKYCFSCQLQAPVMNKGFSMVQKDPDLKDRVKFIAVGTGNNQKEVDSFRRERQIPFPIVPDPQYAAYEAVGDPGATPFTIILRRANSRHIVVLSKLGFIKEPEIILKNLKDSLTPEWDQLIKKYGTPSAQPPKEPKPQLPYSQQELLIKAKESMETPKWKVLGVSRVSLPDGEEVYVGEIQAGKQKSYLFCKLVSLLPACDICHPTHFFLIFNGKGMIVNFLPLELTKDMNRPWDAQDVEKMRRRLIGRSILEPRKFDAHVDSISTATRTATLIIDSLNKAKGLHEMLKARGYIK
jgi:peroxiredoxin